MMGRNENRVKISSIQMVLRWNFVFGFIFLHLFLSFFLFVRFHSITLTPLALSVARAHTQNATIQYFLDSNISKRTRKELMLFFFFFFLLVCLFTLSLSLSRSLFRPLHRIQIIYIYTYSMYVYACIYSYVRTYTQYLSVMSQRAMLFSSLLKFSL